MRRGKLFGLLFVVLSFMVPASAHSQFSPAPVSATTIPSDQLIQAPDLVRVINSGKEQPLILQVGSHIFFGEAHIEGSKFAGPGSQAAGLKLLQDAVASLPKHRPIVLYCGCCPWNRCPNVGPAFSRLRELGFTNVKVLYLPNNFGDDWVAKGYPTDRQ